MLNWLGKDYDYLICSDGATAHIYLRTRFHGMKVCSAKDAPTYTTVPVDENGYYLIDETFFREDVDYLWPIPQTERDVNKNLTQNYGY